MDVAVLICVSTIVFGLILVPPFIMLFRMGKDKKPYRALPPDLAPLSVPCELCHKTGQPGLTEKFVITDGHVRYIHSFYISRSKEVGRLHVSLCAECYLKNASTFSNTWKGNHPFAKFERWHNRNNPIFMETMFERIAYEKIISAYPKQYPKVVVAFNKWFGSISLLREKEWKKMVAENPLRHEYDKYFDDDE
jgi:hypothetical protein